jgi:outer membrane receptor for ferrienterochelin and colicin
MMNWKTFASGAAVSAIALSIAGIADAQVTTSSIRGAVTGDSGAVSSATVTIVHTPTGTVSVSTTDAAGRFDARGLRVGGPYTVTISGGDFQTVQVDDIQLALNETYPLNISVEGDRTLETVIVTASQVASGYLDTGLSTTFGVEDLASIVSIDRDIADAAALDPFASLNFQSGGAKELSIAGANNRFNSLTVDGVALNDRFGLNANGYPTQRSPIPYDAINTLSVETAPYDTEFNGFTGGTINAVTKSGENEFHGSVFYEQTNDDMAGNRTRNQTINQTFDEKSYGATFGGPILKDKLFFFAAYEKYEETAALRTGPLGSGATNEIDILGADIDRITNIMQDVYGFDVGSFGSVPPVTDEKILANIDWNINADHRAKFTYIKTEGGAIREQNGNSFVQRANIGFPSSWYNRSETVETYIGHVFSDWTQNFSTEFKLARTEQATGQDSLSGAEFPLFSVTTSTGQAIALGPDTFRHANDLDQEFLQFKAKAEYIYGDHTFKLGFEREEVDVNNLFGPESEGSYAFASIDDLENRIASSLNYANAITNDENDLRALWGYNYNSIYLQDVWDVLDTLSVQFGLRYDFYESEGSIRPNANFEQRYGFTNANDIDGLNVLLPRASFTWDAQDNLRVRGGVGRFSGGSPTVWLSNSYSNDGVINDDVRRRGGGILVPNAPVGESGNFVPQDVQDELAATLPDGFVAALGPDFEIPTTWKVNLGVAYDISDSIAWVGGWRVSGDVLYNKLENTPYWSDISCGDPISTSPDGRAVYDCAGSGNPEAIVINSFDKGDSLLWALSASNNWATNWGDFDVFTSYTHADVNDIGQGTSSTATSNYSDSARRSYQTPNVGTSNFETEHQFKLRAKWEKDILLDDYFTSASLFATRRSGQPYSYTFATDRRNDVFGIRESRADDAGALIYVPTGPTDPLFSAASFGGDAATQAAFFDYIANGELAGSRGGIAERNGFNSRWTTIVDLRLEQEFPLSLVDGDRATAYLDIENLGNMLNDDWGHVSRVRYEYTREIASASIDNGQYVYDNLNTSTNNEVLGQSLWQAKVGIRYEF